MNLRTLLPVLCLALGSLAAGCGDDEDEKPASTAAGGTAKTAEGGKLAPGDPRPNKPNVVGTDDLTMEELVDRFAADASDYWAATFEKSELPYKRPKVRMTSEFNNPDGEDGCGGKIDLARQPFVVCTGDDGVLITYSENVLTKLMFSGGNVATNVFLVGLGVAADANDQLHGDTLSQTGESPAYAKETACLAGAWVRNLGGRDQFEPGDLEGVVLGAVVFIPAEERQAVRDALAFGYQGDPAACQAEFGEDA